MSLFRVRHPLVLAVLALLLTGARAQARSDDDAATCERSWLADPYLVRSAGTAAAVQRQCGTSAARASTSIYLGCVAQMRSRVATAFADLDSAGYPRIAHGACGGPLAPIGTPGEVERIDSCINVVGSARAGAAQDLRKVALLRCATAVRNGGAPNRFAAFLERNQEAFVDLLDAAIIWSSNVKDIPADENIEDRVAPCVAALGPWLGSDEPETPDLQHTDLGDFCVQHPQLLTENGTSCVLQQKRNRAAITLTAAIAACPQPGSATLRGPSPPSPAVTRAGVGTHAR